MAIKVANTNKLKWLIIFCFIIGHFLLRHWLFFVSSLIIFFFVIARSAATKQSRRAAMILDMAARLLRCARNDGAYYFLLRHWSFLLRNWLFFASSLIIFFFVIARSIATKQSRRAATILDMAARLLRCACNDGAYYFLFRYGQRAS